MINAGSLRHRVTVQQPPATKDGYGRRSGPWSDVATVSASIEEKAGTESDVANQLIATGQVVITIRFPRSWTLTTKMRFKFGDRFFEVGSIQNFENVNCFLVCNCSEVKS